MNFLELIESKKQTEELMAGLAVEYKGKKRGSIFKTRRDYLVNKIVFIDNAIEAYGEKEIFRYSGIYGNTDPDISILSPFIMLLETPDIMEAVAIIEYKTKRKVIKLNREPIKLGVVVS